MSLFRAGLLAASFALVACRAIAGFSDPMTFFYAVNGGNCANCSWIVGEGVIGPDTHEEFLVFLSREDLGDARGLRIHLNSPGGDLIGGVRLGLAFRQQLINTAVSSALVTDIYDSGIRLVGASAEAECSSACVFAFAGGVNRYASESTSSADVGFQSLGRLGVHQFYDPSTLIDPSAATLNAQDRISDQRIIAVLIGYLSEMGVSAELLQLAAATDPRDMHYLSDVELRRVRIDTVTEQEVSLTGYKNGVAVAEIRFTRGEGDYRLELYCSDTSLHMIASIDWAGRYDIDAHQRWSLLDGVSLKDGAPVELVSESFAERSDGGTTGSFRFRFQDSIRDLVQRDKFFFEDWSSRYANDIASSLSFILPEEFDGIHVLPRTCL